MSTNGNGQFLESELIHRKVKVDNEWQTRTFPVVGGRLRLAHEQNESLSLQTELVNWDGEYAVFKCCAVTGKGQYIGHGTANSQRDAKLADSLVELAETRSIARALRFAGFGLEFCSAEEISHLPLSEPATEQPQGKGLRIVTPGEETQSKPERKAPVQSKNVGDSNGGKATRAQCRALYFLAKKAQLSDEDKKGMLASANVSQFEDLSVTDASRFIQHLQASPSA